MYTVLDVQMVFVLAKGPFSEKWNQRATFKNANKLHKSSWKEYKLTEYCNCLHTNQIFFICMHFLWLEVFGFLMLQYQKIMCWDKNVITESRRVLQYCQLFLIQDRTMKKLKKIKKSYSTLAYDWCILQVFELSRTSRFSTIFYSQNLVSSK